MSRRLSAFLFCLVMLSGVLATTRAQAQINPPGVDPTHYWTYKLLDPVVVPNQVRAKDQFFLGYVPIYLDSLERLVNWVRKDNSPVPDSLLHYTWWNIQNKLPNFASAILENQFGRFPINIYNLEFMLVPAWKNQPQPVQPNANHYLCYRAQGQPPGPVPHSLYDEWRFDYQPAGQLEYLCTPCWKEHFAQTYPPVDTLTHLALYRIAPLSDVFVPFIKDQFFTGVVPVRQTPIEYLLVPSLKHLIPTTTRTSTWGKLKTLYR